MRLDRRVLLLSGWHRLQRKAVVRSYGFVYALWYSGLIPTDMGWRYFRWCVRFIDTHPVLPFSDNAASP